MKNKFWRNRLILAGILIALSALVYTIHFLIFHDAHHIFIYLIGDVGFVFIEVLLVSLIIHQILSERERRAMLSKLNMVIGAFYSEAGTELLKFFANFDKNPDHISTHLVVDKQWTDEHFEKVRSLIEKREYNLEIDRGNLKQLRDFIVKKREFLLRLLENPNLLEHESFTQLLWAVFHLAEELSHREDIENLSDSDCEHLAGDITRSYRLVLREWVSYMQHLKNNYPYLFSLAMRTNPFDPEAEVSVNE